MKSKSFPDIEKLLADNKAVKLDYRDEEGDNALIVAARDNSIPIIELLLKQKNIDLELENNDGWTALIEAAYAGNTEAVKMLAIQESNVVMEQTVKLLSIYRPQH